MKRVPVFCARIIVLVISCSLLIGCEAFVRKFTRKTKKENMAKEEMVLAPEEYKGPNMTPEELYRQYFLFWKSWQDELINALNVSGNRKKQIDCANEAIKNLVNFKYVLKPEAVQIVDRHVKRLVDLKDGISADISGARVIFCRQEAERIRRAVLRDLSFPKIKKSLTESINQPNKQ